MFDQSELVDDLRASRASALKTSLPTYPSFSLSLTLLSLLLSYFSTGTEKDDDNSVLALAAASSFLGLFSRGGESDSGSGDYSPSSQFPKAEDDGEE